MFPPTSRFKSPSIFLLSKSARTVFASSAVSSAGFLSKEMFASRNTCWARLRPTPKSAVSAISKRFSGMFTPAI